MDKGVFVVIEGIDGAGKSTLRKRLVKRLRNDGYRVIMTKQPGSQVLGNTIRSLIKGDSKLSPLSQLLLFSADRHEHLMNEVRPALEQGFIVLCDRMADSTYAYQGYGHGIDLSLIRTLNQAVVGSCTPDVTLYLDLDVPTALHRIAERAQGPTDCFETAEFLTKVRQGFEELYQSNHRVQRIDARLSTKEIMSRAHTALFPYLPKRNNQ